MILILNPIASRKAKIAYNFGLSERNRVNWVQGQMINQCTVTLKTKIEKIK